MIVIEIMFYILAEIIFNFLSDFKQSIFVSLTADHPFLFGIKVNGRNLLFIGKVINPTK